MNSSPIYSPLQLSRCSRTSSLSSRSSRSLSLSTSSTAKCHSPISPSSKIHCHQTWMIHNFSKLDLRTFAATFESVPFDSSSIVPKLTPDKIQFSLRLDPNFADNTEDESFVSLYLQFHSTEVHQHKVEYQFSLIGQNLEKLYSRGGEAKFDQLIKCLGFPKYISRDDLLRPDSGYLFQDTLTIYCEVSYTPSWPVQPSNDNRFGFDFQVQIRNKPTTPSPPMEKSIPILHNLPKLYPKLDDEMRDLLKLDEKSAIRQENFPQVKSKDERQKSPKILVSKQSKLGQIWKLFSPTNSGKSVSNGKSIQEPVCESYKKFDDAW